MKCFRVLSLWMLCLSLFSVASAKEVKWLLSAAVERNLVTVTSTASGQDYNEKGIALMVHNTSKKGIAVVLDTALLFNADNNGQYFIAAGGEELTLGPMESKPLLIQTFCANSKLAIPQKGTSYTLGHQADSNVVKLLTYSGKHTLNHDLAQKAVWVITEGKDINTVYEPSLDLESKNVTLFVALLLKKGKPVYYKYFPLNHHEGADTAAITPIADNKPVGIYATFSWAQKADAHISLLVFDAEGKRVQTIFEKQLFNAGRYDFNAKFETAELPRGNYTIRLSDESHTLKDLSVTID